MYVQRNSVTRLLNRFAVETQQCTLYVVVVVVVVFVIVVDLYVTVKYTGCNRRNGPDFGRVFLRSNYTDITQNTYIQS